MVILIDKFSEYLRSIISGKVWGNCIAALIIVNTIVLCMETYPSVMKAYDDLLKTIDQSILYVFILELVLIATFSTLNLFIAVVVDAMQRNNAEDT